MHNTNTIEPDIIINPTLEGNIKIYVNPESDYNLDKHYPIYFCEGRITKDDEFIVYSTKCHRIYDKCMLDIKELNHEPFRCHYKFNTEDIYYHEEVREYVKDYAEHGHRGLELCGQFEPELSIDNNTTTTTTTIPMYTIWYPTHENFNEWRDINGRNNEERKKLTMIKEFSKKNKM